MADKVKGTVKWFSNRKGFGFITPISDIDSESDIAPTEDDIFVHQSGIVMETKESYRTLKDGLEVAYDVITDDNGKLKAVNVTSADGSPCPPPEPRERRRRKKKPSTDSGDADADSSDKEEDETGEEKPKEKKGRKKNDKKTEPSWDTDLEETVKEGLESRNIKIVAGKTFLAIGDARLKLGSGGYAAFAHACGLIAEGKFACETNGTVTITWDHVLKLDGSEWKASTADAEKDVLLSEISLADDAVQATKGENANKPVWGEGKEDPREALEETSFLMRKVVFHHGRTPRGRNRGNRNNKSNNNKNGGD